MDKKVDENSLSEQEYTEKIDEIIEKEKNKRKKLWVIIIILIILLLLLCFSLYILGYKMGKIGYVETGAEPSTIIEITQKGIDFGIIEDLNIFANKQFDYEKIIAPLSYGSYNFKIENLTEQNITYNILMSEKNDWDINLKYKLKLDNVYIIGNEKTWVDIEDMNVYDIIVTDKSENTYTIEWYWEEADNDTKIGEASNAEYKLNIQVDAQLYDKEV